MVDLGDIYNALKELITVTKKVEEHTQKIEVIEKRLEAVGERLDNIDGRLGKVEGKMDAGFSGINLRFDTLEDSIDLWKRISKIEEQLGEFSELSARVKKIEKKIAA